jgi:NAD(P)-dependent dehydrogenase (short-subunit alcohol dehydrogenase family)
MAMATVLVTGGSSGMGKETAKKLLDEGHTVYAAARRLEKMQDLAELGVTVLAMDITKDEEIVAVVDRIAAEQGGIDVLVNNAGFGMYGAMEDTETADARYQFEVNLFGAARLTQLALPYMRERGAGKIVNVSSMGGKIYTPLGSWYHASKHALEAWSDCLRIELAPFGIDVIIIEPGAIETEFGAVMAGPMLERSGESAYRDLAQAIAKASMTGSPPTLIAELIVKAIKARRPRTRYVAGKYARPLMMTRRLLGDRVFDRVVMQVVR